MIRLILLSASGAIVIALAYKLFTRSRAFETDPSGNPMLRYLAAPYVMFVCALIFLAVGIYQWFDPINHRYSGNLLILSYIPALAGILSLGMVVYFFTYKATLRKTANEVSRWPFGTTHFKLSELHTLEINGENTILHFSGNKKYIVYCNYSGHAHFLSALITQVEAASFTPIIRR